MNARVPSAHTAGVWPAAHNVTAQTTRATPTGRVFPRVSTRRMTSLDVWNFAVGIVERYREATTAEITDEARLLHALARDYLRIQTPPLGGRRV